MLYSELFHEMLPSSWEYHLYFYMDKHIKMLLQRKTLHSIEDMVQ